MITEKGCNRKRSIKRKNIGNESIKGQITTTGGVSKGEKINKGRTFITDNIFILVIGIFVVAIFVVGFFSLLASFFLIYTSLISLSFSVFFFSKDFFL